MPFTPDYSGARKFALRIVMFYCGVYYILPFIVFTTIGNPLDLVIGPDPNYFSGFYYVLLFVAVFVLALRVPYVTWKRPSLGINKLAFEPRLILLLAAGFCVFTYSTRAQFGLDFRQSGVTLAESGSLGFLLVIMQSYFGVVILVQYRMIEEGFDIRLRSISLLFVAAGYYFSITGAFDIFFVAFALFAATRRWRETFRLNSKIVRHLSILLLPVLLYLAILVGTANKIGLESALVLMASLGDVVSLLVGRLGYHFTSTSIHASENMLNFYLAFDALGEIAKVVQYRLSVLVGFGGFEKPDVGTVSRMNYLYISAVGRPRVGASPSMIGGTFFLPGAGLAVFYYVFILRGVLRLIWDIVGYKGLTWFSTIFCVILGSAFWDATLDALNPLSTGFLRLFFLYLGARFVTGMLATREARYLYEKKGVP